MQQDVHDFDSTSQATEPGKSLATVLQRIALTAARQMYFGEGHECTEPAGAEPTLNSILLLVTGNLGRRIARTVARMVF